MFKTITIYRCIKNVWLMFTTLMWEEDILSIVWDFSHEKEEMLIKFKNTQTFLTSKYF